MIRTIKRTAMFRCLSNEHR